MWTANHLPLGSSPDWLSMCCYLPWNVTLSLHQVREVAGRGDSCIIIIQARCNFAFFEEFVSLAFHPAQLKKKLKYLVLVSLSGCWYSLYHARRMTHVQWSYVWQIHSWLGLVAGLNELKRNTWLSVCRIWGEFLFYLTMPVGVSDFHVQWCLPWHVTISSCYVMEVTGSVISCMANTVMLPSHYVMSWK